MVDSVVRLFTIGQRICRLGAKTDTCTAGTPATEMCDGAGRHVFTSLLLVLIALLLISIWYRKN